MKKTSIKDIAEHLGVSKSLVSFVLNGKSKEHRISEQISKRVFEVAEELNYKPNQIAKWFRTGKTQTIGLIIADISNPFFAKLGCEIEREASRQGYKVIFCSSDEKPEKFGNQLDMLMKNQVDGYILAPPLGSNAQVEALAKSKVPYVLIDRYFPEIDSNYVIIDNFDAAYEATNHLLNNGFRRIAFISVDNDLITLTDRAKGYRKALKDAGITYGKQLIYKLPFTHEREYISDVIGQLMSPEGKVDGILFSSSKVGLLGLETMVDMGIKVPEDLAIVSFDDPDSYKICFSPVTAVAQPLSEMGAKAVQTVVEEIENDRVNSPSKKIVLKSKFVIRKSSTG